MRYINYWQVPQLTLKPVHHMRLHENARRVFLIFHQRNSNNGFYETSTTDKHTFKQTWNESETFKAEWRCGVKQCSLLVSSIVVPEICTSLFCRKWNVFESISWNFLTCLSAIVSDVEFHSAANCSISPLFLYIKWDELNWTSFSVEVIKMSCSFGREGF